MKFARRPNSLTASLAANASPARTYEVIGNDGRGGIGCGIPNYRT
jgi:hypothetical protein